MHVLVAVVAVQTVECDVSVLGLGLEVRADVGAFEMIWNNEVVSAVQLACACAVRWVRR